MPVTKLRFDNFSDINVKERTRLNAPMAINDTLAVVENAQGITAGTPIYIGRLGSEFSERVAVSAVTTGGQLTTGVAIRAHRRFADVTAVFGDRIRVYRAANVDGSLPADTAFAVYATIDIDPDQLTTDYIDALGGIGFWYKITYQNSISNAETDLTQVEATRGGDFGHYVTLEAIRRSAGLGTNYNITDSTVDAKRAAAEDTINGALVGAYTIPFADPVPPKIIEITTQLAAGLLMTDQYSSFSSSIRQAGKAKVDEAMAWLSSVKSGDNTIVDPSGNSLKSQAASGFSGWPNETTAQTDADQGGSERMFRASDQF